MTANDPNSDYDTPSTDLFKLLPQPYQSDTNRAVISNLFNRFLSKTETTHVVGYIGDGNPAAVTKRQIKEPTVHRQGYQLQPLLYEKIGSVEHIWSWYDVLNGLTAQGVDVSRQNIWGAALEFNWAPPIDINKIVNYRDYYWFDPNNPQSQPQYITVKSECSYAMALVSFYNGLIAQNGATFNIIGVIPAQTAIVISGNFTTLFAPDFIFYIENTTNPDLNNSFQQVVSSTYDTALDTTTIVMTIAFASAISGGNISLNQQLAIYEGIQQCKCTGSSGWDILPWDDNQVNNPPPLWNAAVIADIAFATLPQWNTAHPIPAQYDIWWDTTNDILYSLENVSNPTNITSWKALYSNFSLIEQQTTGAGYWDLETGCADSGTIMGLDQWISENHWVHKADVSNFSIAKQAQIPIIEFEPNLELSEWATTSYLWQYRSVSQLPYAAASTQPNRFELEPLNMYTSTLTTITLDERFGDLTNVFTPGYNFLINLIGQEWTVLNSVFERSSLPLGAFQTTITVTQPLPGLTASVNYLYPKVTSQGDAFTTYNDQWLFIGAGTTLAINHQPENNMMTPTVVGPAYPTYTTKLAAYAEEFDIITTGVQTLNFDAFTPPGSTRSLSQRALVGADDVRVYVNTIRQYGTYDELGSVYVTGVYFHNPLQATDVVLVQVGEATYQDFGNYAVPVRTVSDDTEFAAVGTQLVSLVQLRKVEQVKTEINQYPLFDIYNTNSTSANIANPIFGYHEDPSGVLYTYVGQRIVQAADGSIDFQNYLVNGNNGPLYAYRNYNKSADLYWFNTNTNQVLVWTGKTWATKYSTNQICQQNSIPTTTDYWLAPLVQATLPTPADPAYSIPGLLVFNTTNNTLYVRNPNQVSNILPNVVGWSILSVHISTADETLETNWRHGSGNEQFIPQQVDWERRSYPTYTDEYNAYIVKTSAELIQADPSLTQAQANAEADTMWTAIQERSIVQSWYTDQTLPLAVRQGPLWIGNWQIPDPLYFNSGHEDWLYISATDLLTHFVSIVDAQPSFPGYGGQSSANWRLIDYTNINWGLGGTIKEYDNSFDTFLSSQFIDTVTPPSLFDFAQNEYENIIVILRDLLTRNFVTYMTNVDPTVILDPSGYAANQVITQYEENEAANLVYGDSTTYTQATLTTPASGIHNWIATLPFFGIIPKTAPYIYSDSVRGLLEIVHHDGHRATYQIPQTVVGGLQRAICNTPDTRAGTEKFGRISTLPPPPTQTAFITQFSPVLRNGVYWLKGAVLYRIAVANVGPTPPSISVPDGALWWDTNTLAPTLRQKTTVGMTVFWNPAPGLVVGDGKLFNGATVETSTASAWEIVNLNQIYHEVILTAETDLYNQVPPAPIIPPINFAAIQAEDPALYDQYLQQQFNTYTHDLQIATPFANPLYNPADPFTWNYKYSTITAPQPHAGTIPSGGCWQDVYEKAYGTPYPHLEPWKLQGYTNKPTWWDGFYLNTTGGRRWRYAHSLPILAITLNSIVISGDVTELFTGITSFTVDTNAVQSVFDVVSVVFAVGNTTITTVQTTAGIIPGTSLVSVGMWDYILRGIIPTGQSLPLNVNIIPTYAYVSVNISDQTFTAGSLTYRPDDVLPPYWTIPFAMPNANQLPIRSLFASSGDVTLENAAYLWGDKGTNEWLWNQTTNYLYSLLTVAYLMEPVRTIANTFGTTFNYIDSLPIDSLTGKVFSHADTQFHGEITVDNQVVQVNGINQWYVNFNRASGLDTSYSDFRAQWTGWTAPLSYQLGGFADTSSFSVDHRVVQITPNDYALTMKRSPGVANYWIDAFNIRITSMPPNYNLYDTQSEWTLEVDSLAPISRTVSYYAVKLYDFYVDQATSTCYLFTYPIVAANPAQKSFVVDGDVTQVFGSTGDATQFTVTGNNAGTYTVVSASYDPITNQTTLIVDTAIPTSTPGGLLTAINYRTLPWNTGDVVSVATTELLPLPLDPTLQYFIIKLSPTSFQLAYNALDVTANIPILFTSRAVGIQRVGELYNTFLALNGAHSTTTWSHYNVDTSVVKMITLPSAIVGIQNFINILTGYAAYIKAQGFGINLDGAYNDPATGQLVSWQNELERFIDWAYQQRSVRRQRMNDKYPVDIDYGTGKFTFTSQNPGYITGTQVVMWSFEGGLPPPLMIGQTYFIINNNDGTVSLASNFANAYAGTAITISYVGGVGKLYMSTAELYAAELPTYEVNAFRNAMWFAPSYGIVSNIVVGPFADILSTQLIFDQYGRRLSNSDIRVFRQDKLTQIQFASGVYNDVNTLQNNQQNPYQYLHIGGANIYLDTYEHILKFNDYTTAGALLYDPFLGLNVTKFELDFYKQSEFTERPNVGGYFLSQPYNQGANLDRNIEGSIEDLRYMYDPYKIPETLPAVVRARGLLGYEGVSDSLSQINLTSKSQFLFWKGTIHNKGSLNMITAFINSRRFVNAKVDEFWAYKLADFGPVQVPEYLSMYLTIGDTQTNDLRLGFTLEDQVCLPGYAEETFGNTDCGYANPQDANSTVTGVDATFTPISMTNQARWWNQPDQLEALVPDGGVLYFNLKAKQKIVFYTTTLQVAPGGFNPFDPDNLADPTSPLYAANLTDETGVIAYDPTNSILAPTIPEQQHYYTAWTWNAAIREFVYAGGWDPISPTALLPINIRHNFKADTVTMTMDWYPNGAHTTYVIPTLPSNVKQLTLTVPYLPLTNSLSVFKTPTGGSTVQLHPGVDYVESLEVFGGSNILGYKLYFANTISNSTVEVVYTSSQLSQDPGNQYQIVNTNIVGLLSQEIITNLFANNSTLTLWGLTVDKESQNPAKIIDTQAQTVLTPVTFWDPARGYHYYEALHTVNIQSNTDPAQYDLATGGLAGWKDSEVGTAWLDTTNVDYVPYYDGLAMTDAEDRYSNWGQLADYGSVKVFQWTKSSVPPDQYNALAAVQESDNTIDASIRLSGTVRQDVRYRNRVNTPAVATPSTAGKTIINLSTPKVLTDLTGLAPTTVSTTSYAVTITIDGIVVRTVSLSDATISTYGDLIEQLNLSLNPYGATASLNGNNIVITSDKSGSSSSIAISSDVLFTSLPNYSSTAPAIPGVSAKEGYEVLNFSPISANTATGLVYTPGVSTGDLSYSTSITTFNGVIDGTYSLTETRTARGSQLATFGDVIGLLQTCTNAVVTSTLTTIKITDASTLVTSGNPSVVAISDDSFLFNLPGFISIVSTPSSINGVPGYVTLTYASAFPATSTGLAPTMTSANDTTYSFNVSVNGLESETVTVKASQAQTYGELVSVIGAQLSAFGAGIELLNTSIRIKSNTAGVGSTISITPGTLWTATALPAFLSVGGTFGGIDATSGSQAIVTTITLTDSVLTGLGPVPVPSSYNFTITVDGSFARSLTYAATQLTTFGDLLRILSAQFAVYNATITLVGNQLIISSKTIGIPSRIDITADMLFNSITGWVSTIGGATPGYLGANQQISVASPALFSVGGTVLFSSTETLPTGLTPSQVYTIQSINTPNIGDINLVNAPTITSAGTGTLTMASSVWPTTWILDQQQRVDLDPSIDATQSVILGVTTYTFPVSATTFAGKMVNIYVNGKLVQENYVLPGSGNLVFPTTSVFPVLNTNISTGTSGDRVTFIIPVHTPTSTELAFNPSVADDGSVQIQYQYITNYVATQQFDTQLNTSAYTYYFWVENKTTNTGTRESISEAAIDIVAPPAPYMFFVGRAGDSGMPVSPTLVVNTETGEVIQEPYRYTQAIVHGLRGYVDDENRYVLRFTRDFTLRDNLAFGTSPLQLKDAHQEWLMFREQQLSNVPQDLWNKITEAMAGYLLSDPSTRVPSLARELYDQANGASTRYGIGMGQAFCDGPTAIATVTAYLNDPKIDFYPLDMDNFFANYNFDTPANCIATMNQIYNTFSYIHVNQIFFSVLLDALSVQNQYADLMKTSAIALYGIELLDVAGVFDD